MQFLAQIKPLEPTHAQYLYVGSAIGLILFCLLPITRNIKTIGTGLIFLLFIGTSLGYQFFPEKLEYQIAKQIGYFSDRNPFSETETNHMIPTFLSSQGGYALNIPGNWVRKTLKDGQTPYFLLQSQKGVSAELRPRCSHNSTLSMARIVSINMKPNDAYTGFSRQCFKYSSGFDACLAKRRHKEQFWRWQLLIQNHHTGQGINLDFLIYKNSPEITKQIRNIMATIQLTEPPKPLPRCLTPTQWF